jgi:hypothetical protein
MILTANFQCVTLELVHQISLSSLPLITDCAVRNSKSVPQNYVGRSIAKLHLILVYATRLHRSMP